MQQNLVGWGAVGAAIVGVAAAGIHLDGVPIYLTATLAALSRLRPESIVIVLVLTCLSMVLSGAIWSRILRRLGHAMPFRVGLTAYLSAGLAGYIVNAAGPAVGCAVTLRRHGICAARAVLLSLIANVLGLCGVLVWAPVGLVLLSRSGMNAALPVLGRHDTSAALGVLVALAVAMLIALWALASAPASGRRLAHRFLKKDAHNDEATERAAPDLPLRTRHLLALVPLSAASWIVGALALYVVLGALNPGADLNLGDVIGSAVLAALLGSLAFFVPAGIGVKDGALVALLAHSTGLPVASCAAAAIAMRAVDPLAKVGMLGVLALGLGRLLVPRLRRTVPTGAAHDAPHAAPTVISAWAPLHRLPPTQLRPFWRATVAEPD